MNLNRGSILYVLAEQSIILWKSFGCIEKLESGGLTMRLIETKSDVELKTCPFCGGKATLFYDADSGLYQAKCNNYDCWIGPETSFYSEKETAVEAWQERAEPVRHGWWIYDHWCEFKCSECGNLSNSKPYKGRENYCPNCGAKMDGESE